MAKITSSPLTFVDTTDSRKFEVHISSNLPQVQIYDQNNKTYSPDWSKTALNLQASIYLDSTDITANTSVTVEWYKNSISTATKIGTGKTLTINTNVLSTEPIITYICQAKYQNLTTSTRIDYTRIDSGVNGSSGTSAPAVQAQYSVDGTAWTTTLNAATHKYIRHSYDGGKTWTTAIKMVGEDGKSVAIKGTATSVTAVSSTNYYTVTYGGTAISTATLGDSYLYGGDLYVCSELRDGADYFINVGKIQGAKGNDGESSYVYIRYATSSSGANMTANPSNQTTYIGIHVSSATTAPTTASSYTWSKFVGDSAKSIILSGDSQVFKVSKSSAYTPATINVTAQTINTSVTSWTYNTNDGKGFVSTAPTGVARNGNIVTITGSTLVTDSIVIKASDGSVEDIFTVYKAFDGTNGNPGTPGAPASMAFLTNENVTFGANSDGIITSATITTNVVAYSGATKTTPTIGTISGLPTGMTAKIGTAINSEVPIVFTITNSNLGSTSNNNGSITIPVNGPVYTNLILTWSKVNSGAKGDKGDKGVSIKSTTVTYGTSDSASTLPVDTAWQSTIPTVAEGEYLWTRTIIDYTDDAIADTVTYTYAKQGTKGDAGSSGSSVTVSSIQYQEGVSATTTPTGTWSNSVVSVAEGKYLWTKTAFSDGKIAYGVAKQGVSGKDGVGINSTTVSYGSSDSFTVKPTVWYPDIPAVEDGKYLWTRTVTDYTDTSKADTVTYVYAKQGTKGDTGSSGTSVTVKSIKYQSGTSATAAPTGTWSDSVVAVAEGNYLWTQTTFSDNKVAYGVAKQGAKGSAGADAYTVILTNESHVFAGNVSSAIASSATTQVMAYKGSTSQSITIVSVDGKTASTNSTATSIAGLSFSCSALSGTTPTITFTCTTSFVSPSGTIPIVVKVDGVTITKMFTYGIAFKGATGSQGTTGTAASLVDITPSAHYFKSTTGKDGTFTPDYIYLYPRFQTVTFSKWEYSINGGTTWVAASGANGLSISTYNSVANTLRIARTSTLYTDTVTSISFRCVSSNSSVYDTVSIAKIYDVVDLQIGGRNLLLNSRTPLLISSNNSVEYPILTELITEGTRQFRRIKRTNITSNPNTMSLYNAIAWSMLTDEIRGKAVTMSFAARASHEAKFTIFAGGYNPAVNLSGNPGQIDIGTEWKRFTMTTTIPTDVDSGIRFCPLQSNTIDDLSTFYLDVCEWQIEFGNKATDWSPAPEDLNNITFQIYAPNGYLLTNDLPSITLQTFAYEGSIEITSGATFQWSQLVDDVWTNITSATGTTLTVTKSDVLKSKSYRCIMNYKSKEYISTVTAQDKTDTYNSIMCISSNAKGAECYWVLHTIVYSDTSEIDPLLGPISINAPESPVNGDYWYAVDSTNATVQLKKYNGTAWVNSTDKQSLTYLWNIINDGSAKTPIGGASKVQVVSCRDFTATATLMCDVSNEVDGILTQSSLSITDASDPIVSETEPTSAVDGQIWIKPNTNGSYNMFLWSKATQSWIPSDMDTRNKVYTSKPSSYSKGDIWITESDTAHSKYLEGTLLQATKDNTTYNEDDWSATLKYDKDIDEIKGTLYDLAQYVTITSAGLKIGAVNSNNELSPFTSLFTSTELAFYQNSNKLLTLANNQLTAPRVVVEKELEVDGKISLGNLEFTIETNGSFSIAVTK